MNEKNTNKIAQVKNHAGNLLMEVHALTEEKYSNTLTATDELLTNKNANAIPKLFLRYIVATNEEQHIKNAAQHIIEALKELEAAEKFRTDMQRDIR